MIPPLKRFHVASSQTFLAAYFGVLSQGFDGLEELVIAHDDGSDFCALAGCQVSVSLTALFNIVKPQE